MSDWLRNKWNDEKWKETCETYLEALSATTANDYKRLTQHEFDREYLAPNALRTPTAGYVATGCLSTDSSTNGSYTVGWYVIRDGVWKKIDETVVNPTVSPLVQMKDFAASTNIVTRSPLLEIDYNEPDNDWDDLPESIQEAIECLEYDNVFPEADRIIIANERFHRIDHNGAFGFTIVDTKQYECESFGCGYDPETKTLCVKVYEMPQEQKHELPATVQCKCMRNISTYGLIGDVVTCDGCGRLVKVA